MADDEQLATVDIPKIWFALTIPSTKSKSAFVGTSFENSDTLALENRNEYLKTNSSVKSS